MSYINYQRNREEFFCSWPVILFFLYLFFPIGIYLIIKKQLLHRRNIFTIGKNTLSSGISLLILSFFLYLPKIILLFCSKDNQNYKDLFNFCNSNIYLNILKFTNILIIVGIIVISISIYQKIKCNNYRKYISIVANRGFEDFDEIASKINQSKSTVIKTLKKMIKDGYLDNYDLAEDENRIFNIDREQRKIELKELNKEHDKRVVRCPNCHANNLLEEKIGKCAYCNSYIE